ncbi:LSM1 protein [Capsaspora owczarzaki ATCC 30864]|uniref:U6 snRNA-associated Sm-like protein LSm1 n=1 Tax=Capsaspora owczarzaki (strain ATCC 30864) TaxID=595528 RepID=A0A0D2WQN8_CAPO3|nr:LSM1 protein [Capsaspora owczarzaki ATCC 30864]KJE93313.1 LSM1 protein [Capsaspora owczarzaki ATCC 30864]|eukprot:XP_004347944.1 LSM1 protein [Capsaspora owczarzaki ATCC 30864]
MPHQYFPGSASLLEELDKKLMVVLRDGRKLIGFLRSFDQFANLVLQDTIERIYVGDAYGDIPRGIFLIRGENVVLLGEIDLQKDAQTTLRQLPVEEILVLQREEQERIEAQQKIQYKVMLDRGLQPVTDALYEDTYS